MGDGDAAVMDALSTISPYPVCKEECINHVTKYMFSGVERIFRDVSAEVKVNKAKVSTTVAE